MRGSAMSSTRNAANLLVRVVTLLTLVLGILALPALAQTNKGSIKGTVKDPNGAVVQKASVTATNTATGISRTATAGDDGTYEVPELEPGTYKVSIKATGFSDTEQRSEEHTSELQSHLNLVCRLLLEKKKNTVERNIE